MTDVTDVLGEREIPGATTAPAVDVRDLHVRLDTERGEAHILRGVSFGVQPGQMVALAGESGSGKSTVLLAMTRLLPPGARLEGQITALGHEVAQLRPHELRAFRARTARLVFQDPWSALHPLKSVGGQLIESARAAQPDLSRRAARDLAGQTLAKVGISDAASRMRSYPHEVSGGQLQRVMIAMALVASPRLLLCDEPTTALDVTTQAQILELLHDLNTELGLTVVIATHDLDVIADLAHRLVVMYAGQVVEEGPTGRVLDAPRHPYSLSLLEAAPGIDSGARLRAIEGRPPSPLSPVPGCAFAPRCDHAQAVCTAEEPVLRLMSADPAHGTACLLVQDHDEAEVVR